MAFANPEDRFNPNIRPRDPNHQFASWRWIDNSYIRPCWALEFFDENNFHYVSLKCTEHTVDALIDRIRMGHAATHALTDAATN